MKKNNFYYNIREGKDSGFTLLIAIIVTSMLLIVSFVVVNISLKQLILASAAVESQHAFYAADSGTECVAYWDLQDSNVSAFATSTAGTISCNNQTISTGSQTVPTVPTQSSRIGGGGSANPTSIFNLNFTKGCAIVRVTKAANGDTTVDSRGYNTCNTSAARRFERGVILTFSGGANSSLPPAPFDAPFNYSLSNSADITVVQGSAGSNTITRTLIVGTTEAVSLSASGLPSGATAVFTPNSCSPTCGSTLRITTAVSTPSDTYPITVTGSPLSKTTTFSLIVNSGVPTVNTLAASLVGPSSTNLNGQVNPNGVSTTGWFRYSSTNPGTCNNTFGTRSPTSGGTAIGSGTSLVGYSGTANGLSLNTTYYYCAIASSSAGTGFGNIVSFTTSSPATGGTITYTDSSGLNPRASPPYSGGYAVHTFTSSCTNCFVVTTGGTMGYLVVGGGGGGGFYYAGGGAGGYRTGTVAVTAQAYSITVGAGGNGPTSNGDGNALGARGSNGGNSVFSTITATGGGGGRWDGISCVNGASPGTGGSGGAGAGAYSTGCSTQTMAGAAGNTPSTSPAQGFAGGSGSPLTGDSTQLAGGGGGGSSGGGSWGGVGGTGGDGGGGTPNSISGTSKYYASGGAGGGSNGNGSVSTGGGGSWGSKGTSNTGGGGGGTNSTSGAVSGGSGIVIIRYLYP